MLVMERICSQLVLVRKQTAIRSAIVRHGICKLHISSIAFERALSGMYVYMQIWDIFVDYLEPCSRQS